MMNYIYIKKELLPNIKKSGRMLEYYLIQNLFEDKEEKVINELVKYQNFDGGFGNGLEPDLRMKESSVAATNYAVYILEQISREELKANIIEKVVSYFENSYISKLEAWEIVPKEVSNSPRAIWWNYEGIESFTYGNPNPEVIGFLYKNKELLKKIDISYHINKVVKYVNIEFEKNVSMHSVLSVLRFYEKMNNDTKLLIKDKLSMMTLNELEKSSLLWDKYTLEPYLINLIVKDNSFNNKELLKDNLNHNLKKIRKGVILPQWEWYQYDDIFRDVKFEWGGLLTYNVIKSLIENDMFKK